MPRANDINTLHSRILERLQLVLADECQRGSGRFYDHLVHAVPEVPNIREELKKEAGLTLDVLRREGKRASTRQGAEQLLHEPHAPLPALPRRARPMPAPTPAPVPASQADAQDPWPFVQLRIDWAKCFRETDGEPGADEMYLAGVMVDLSDPDSDRYSVKFHLGDFRTGDREEYDGTQVVDYIDISDAKRFPTGVRCFLCMMEKDAEWVLADVIGDLLDVAKSVIDQQLEAGEEEEGDIFTDPGYIDWEVLFKKMLDLLFGWLRRWIAPEVLTHRGRPVFQFESPRVKSLADTWGTTHKSKAKIFEVKGYGGVYRIKLFFRRAKTKTGA